MLPWGRSKLQVVLPLLEIVLEELDVVDDYAVKHAVEVLGVLDIEVGSSVMGHPRACAIPGEVYPAELESIVGHMQAAQTAATMFSKANPANRRIVTGTIVLSHS